MIHIQVVRFDIPKDSPSVVARRVDEALQNIETSPNAALRMVFTVSPISLLRKKQMVKFKHAVEPFRYRVKRSCVENVIVVQNPAVRAVVRASLFFFQPEVPTRVVDRYFA